MQPGTPEYQKAYDDEMNRLEAGTEPEKVDDPITEPGKAEEPEKAPEAEPEKPDPLADIQARLDKTEKALKDTQAWGTRNAQELAKFRKEQEEHAHKASRPLILDEQPELEEAIRHVAGVQSTNEGGALEPQAWVRQVMETLPDISTFMAYPAFN